ncbi:hypothetical protein GYB61_00210 [bacterium]|nr:hypothetical protein [bacterium]
MAAWLQDVNVGDWFQVGRRQLFEIVALDLRAETIEVQYFDGTVAEIAFENWTELAAVPAAAPEDIRGAMDMESMDAIDVWQPMLRNPLERLDLYA